MKLVTFTFSLLISLFTLAAVNDSGYLRYNCDFDGDLFKGEVYINSLDIAGLSSCMEMNLNTSNMCWRFQRSEDGSLNFVLRSKHSIYVADNIHHNNDPISGSYHKIYESKDELSSQSMFIYDYVVRSGRVVVKSLFCKFSAIDWH